MEEIALVMFVCDVEQRTHVCCTCVAHNVEQRTKAQKCALHVELTEQYVDDSKRAVHQLLTKSSSILIGEDRMSKKSFNTSAFRNALYITTS